MVLRFTESYCGKRALLSMSWNKENRKLFIDGIKYGLAGKGNNGTRSKQMVFSKRLVRAYHFPQLTDKQFMRDYWHYPEYEVDTLPEPGEGPYKVPRQLGMTIRVEKRLDVFLFRCHFAESFIIARKIIEAGNVKINNRVEINHSHILEPGDLVKVNPEVTPLISGRASFSKKKDEYSLTPFMAAIPEYIEVDYLTCSAIFLRDPLIFKYRIDVPIPFSSQIYEACYEHYNSRYRTLYKNKSKKLKVDQCAYVSGERTGLKKEFNERLNELENRKEASEKHISSEQYPKRAFPHRVF